MSLRSHVPPALLLLLAASLCAPSAVAEARAAASSGSPWSVARSGVTSGAPDTGSVLPAFVGFFTYGDAVFDAGPLPKAWVDKHPELRSQLAGKRAGYKCTVLSMFWAVIWRSSCTAVAFSGKTYLSEDRLPSGAQNWIADLNRAIDARYKPSDMKMGFWTRHGRWILGGVVLLFLLGRIFRRRSGG